MNLWCKLSRDQISQALDSTQDNRFGVYVRTEDVSTQVEAEEIYPEGVETKQDLDRHLAEISHPGVPVSVLSEFPIYSGGIRDTPLGRILTAVKKQSGCLTQGRDKAVWQSFETLQDLEYWVVRHPGIPVDNAWKLRSSDSFEIKHNGTHYNVLTPSLYIEWGSAGQCAYCDPEKVSELRKTREKRDRSRRTELSYKTRKGLFFSSDWRNLAETLHTEAADLVNKWILSKDFAGVGIEYTQNYRYSQSYHRRRWGRNHSEESGFATDRVDCMISLAQELCGRRETAKALRPVCQKIQDFLVRCRKERTPRMNEENKHLIARAESLVWLAIRKKPVFPEFLRVWNNPPKELRDVKEETDPEEVRKAG